MKTALLILDMLNRFDFPEGRALEKRAWPVAQKIRSLKDRCRRRGMPIVYVNDNFGDWKSDRDGIINECLQKACLGSRIAKLLRPDNEDFFVLKPKHSGFYSTNLEPLLDDLRIRKLIIVGIAGDICVLFTAHDAHMREYDIVVPRDCVASNTSEGDRFLLYQLKQTLKFPVTASRSLRL